MDEERSVCERLALVMADGAPPDSEQAMDLAAERRSGLRRWFFDGTPEAHAAFADMFGADERMRASFEGISPGLTDYLRRAVHSDTARLERATEG